MSHPTWVRGLKQHLKMLEDNPTLSHPTWVRGLKQNKIRNIGSFRKSHPTWVRGLKLFFDMGLCHLKVAPYVGAWIETRI